METNEDHLNGNKQTIYSELAIVRDSAIPSFVFGRDSKAGRGIEKLYMGEREDFRRVLVVGCYHEEAGSQLTRSRASYVIGLKRVFGFVGLKLEDGSY